MRAERSIYVERPTEEVFWFLADHANDRRWRDELVGMDIVGDVRQGVGTHTCETISYQGRTLQINLEVTDFIPGERICLKAHGGVRAHGCVAVRPEGKGTRVSISGTAELKGSAAMMERYVMQAIELIAEDDLERLRVVLESSSGV